MIKSEWQHGIAATTKPWGYELKCKVTGKCVQSHTGGNRDKYGNDIPPWGLPDFWQADFTIKSVDDHCGALHVIEDIDGQEFDCGHVAQLRRSVGSGNGEWRRWFLVCSASERWAADYWLRGERANDPDMTPDRVPAEDVAVMDRQCRMYHRRVEVGPDQNT